MLGMLDGLLPLLVRGLRSRHAAVASLALRCLALLVPLPLPGVIPLPQGIIFMAPRACFIVGEVLCMDTLCTVQDPAWSKHFEGQDRAYTGVVLAAYVSK